MMHAASTVEVHVAVPLVQCTNGCPQRCDSCVAHSKKTNAAEVRIATRKNDFSVSTMPNLLQPWESTSNATSCSINARTHQPLITNDREMAMKSLGWLCAVALALATPSDADVRNNGRNCANVRSCRPRCITFRIDRETQRCDSSEGIFSVESNLNPWAVSKFETSNCFASDTCANDSCGDDLTGDLTVRIGEVGASGSLYYSNVFIPEGGDERFTYCSVYPCPKEECAVPEQMVSA